VKRWLSQEDRKEKNARLAQMRNQGNHIHNCKVRENKSGELIVKRGPNEGQNPDYRNYLPCNLCLVWMSKVQIYRHPCSEAEATKKPSRKLGKEIAEHAEAGITEAMAKVLASLADDEKGHVVRNDFLLREYLRFQTESELVVQKKWRDQLRGKLRNGARLLIQLRKEFPHCTFLEILKKDNFNKILAAAKACAVGEGGQVFCETTMKIGHLLTELINRATAIAIRANDHERLFDLGQLEKLKRMEWTVRVVKGSKFLIAQRQTNQIINLPTTADVVKFSKGLTESLEQALLSFEDNPTLTTFRNLQKMLLVKVITFNRKGYTDIFSCKIPVPRYTMVRYVTGMLR
jgi:hypothetical protein